MWHTNAIRHHFIYAISQMIIIILHSSQMITSNLQLYFQLLKNAKHTIIIIISLTLHYSNYKLTMFKSSMYNIHIIKYINN